MSGSSPRQPPDWSGIGVLAMLGGVVVVGLAANGLSLPGMLVALSFAAGILGFARLWQLSLPRPERPLSRWQWAGTAAVAVVLLAVAAVLVWWCVVDPTARTR
jgi:hypothetical protein